MSCIQPRRRRWTHSSIPIRDSSPGFRSASVSRTKTAPEPTELINAKEFVVVAGKAGWEECDKVCVAWEKVYISGKYDS